MLRTVNLRDYILPNPVKVHAHDSILDAMKVIIDNKISGVCVVDEKNNLVGILSELDCLRAALGAVYNRTSIGGVRDYMASDNLVVQLIARSLLMQFMPQMSDLRRYAELDRDAHKDLARELDEAMGQRDLTAVRSTLARLSEVNRQHTLKTLEDYEQAQTMGNMEVAAQ